MGKFVKEPTMDEWRELARASTVVTMPGPLPPPITLEDCRKHPDLKLVRRFGKMAYAIQLFHIQDMRKDICTSSLTERQKDELLAETRIKFDTVKAEALRQFPE
jgi:hypothetical protein